MKNKKFLTIISALLLSISVVGAAGASLPSLEEGATTSSIHNPKPWCPNFQYPCEIAP